VKKSSILWCAAGAIWIAALAGCGSATNSVDPTTTLDTAAPQAPVGLAVGADASGARALLWTANSEPDLGSYQVYQASASSGSAYTLVATVGASATSWRLPPGDLDTMWFKLRAVDRTGNRSAESSVYQATLVPGPTGRDDSGDDATPKHH
jgi:hypothetical protein